MFTLRIWVYLSVIFGSCYLGKCAVPSKRILLLPFVYASHVSEFGNVGAGLQEMGHEVYILLSESYPDLEKWNNSKLHLLTFSTTDPDYFTWTQEFTDTVWEELPRITPLQDFRQNTAGFMELCTNALRDVELFQTLSALSFDLAVVDAVPCSRCYYIIPHKLDIPLVSLTTHYDPWFMRAPALPSFVPFAMGVPFSEKMTFWERVHNLWTIVEWSVSPRIPYVEDHLVKTYAPEKPFVTINELARRSLLWLIHTDVIIDYPRPTMANEVNIGGLTTKPAKPLPPDLQAFMDSATEGVVVVSFGSMDSISKNVLNNLLKALTHIDQSVVWRSSHQFDQAIPSNIKLLKWIPQNDLLGHPNTKLFITHCGANGQFEALYHGVPMIGLPMFGDQPYNANRMAYHGFGLAMDILTFEPQELVNNINEIIQEQTYTVNIKKASRLFRSRPQHPRDRAVYWIGHVLEYGAEHLHSYGQDMPWYQLLMLDIFVCFLVISLALCCVIWKFISMILNTFVRKSRDGILYEKKKN